MSVPHPTDSFRLDDSRVADLGFCPDCYAGGQTVLVAAGADRCGYHVRIPRPAVVASAPPAYPTHAPAPVRPGATRTAGRRADSAAPSPRPRRRRTATAPAPDGTFRAPHVVAVVCALPAGSRRAADQVDAFRALDSHEGLLALRGDRQATIGAVWRALVLRADYATRTVTVVWAELQAASGRSRATVARALAWLRDAGLLGTVHTGASAACLGGDVNRAPTYVLAVPVALPVDEFETPTDPEGSVSRPYAREDAREREAGLRPLAKSSTTEPSSADLGRRRATAPAWSMGSPATTRREQLELAELLRWHAVTLRPVSARMLRHILRPWLEAGWSAADVLYALDHRPDGAEWRYAGLPRAVAAWIRYRLAAWLDELGRPRPSRSQLARADADARRQARAGGRA